MRHIIARFDGIDRMLVLLMTIFVLKAVIFGLVFAPFSGHDEVMHYAYLDMLATEGRVPVIPDLEEWRADWTDSDISTPRFDHAPSSVYPWASQRGAPKSSFTTEDWFGGRDAPVWAINLGAERFPSGWIYTSNHPPLYYTLMTPILWAVGSLAVEEQIFALRLATIPIGLVAVVFAWAIARRLFPKSTLVPVVATTFFVMQPQATYESAMLNNDVLAIALIAAVLYGIVEGVFREFPTRTCVLTGLALGLALLAKSTALMVAPVIAFAVVATFGLTAWRRWAGAGGVIGGVAALVCWPWYLHMYLTYGDFTALDRVKALQYWNYRGTTGRTIGDQLTDPDFAWARWRETWGDFGWRLIPLDDRLLWTIFAFCAVGVTCGLGWLIRASRLELPGWFRRREPIESASARVVCLWAFAGYCALSYYAVLQFGTSFALTQARYAFPALIPFGILLAIGYFWAVPRRAHAFATAVFVVAGATLNVAILTVYVIPYWFLSA